MAAITKQLPLPLVDDREQLRRERVERHLGTTSKPTTAAKWWTEQTYHEASKTAEASGNT